MIIIEALLDYSRPWSSPTAKIFTGNPIVRKDGALVMGRGAALAVKTAHPQVPYMFKLEPDTHLAWVTINRDQHIGWFKVKHHWRSDADLALIEESARQLGEYARFFPRWKFEMNYPGVGNGRLKDTDVFPVLAGLPDNVHIYR